MSLRPELNQRKKSNKTMGYIQELIKPLSTLRLVRREDIMPREDKHLKKPSSTVLDQSQQLPLDDASHQPPLNRETWLESIPALVQGVWSEDHALQLEATTQLRKLLSIGMDEVIKAGVVPRLVEFLGRDDLPQLQYESGWALTNVAAGSSEHTRVVIEQGAVPRFVRLLSSANDDVREQAVWALGNVAADSTSGRNLVLRDGALMPLLDQLNENSRMSMLRQATWSLSNICEVKPPTPFEQVKPALPVLSQLIHSNDEQVLTSACRSLAYLSDGFNDKIQAVIEAGVCPRLVGLMLHSSPEVILHATWAVGNIVTGNDAQTQAVIEANIIPPLLHILKHAAEFDIKKEAAWAIINAFAEASQDQIRYLVSQGCIKSLCDLLTCPELIIVYKCQERLKKILEMGEAEIKKWG